MGAKAAPLPPRQDATTQQNDSARTVQAGTAWLLRTEGRAVDAEGVPLAGSVGVTFAIYSEAAGGAPLWQETQVVSAAAGGRFRALLGAASESGVPVEIFAGGQSRWLGMLVHAPGNQEQPRLLLVSVPFAVEAANAESLGGVPASSYVRAEQLATAAQQAIAQQAGAQQAVNATGDAYINRGTVSSAVKGVSAISASNAVANYIPVFSDSLGDLATSSLYMAGSGYFGVNTSNPQFNLHVISVTDPAAIAVEGYGVVGVNFIGRRAEGTLASPSALLLNDNFFALQGRGYGATGFSSSSRAYIKFFAAQNWTDTAQGSYISLATTPLNTAATAEAMRILPGGQVGIGTTTPDQMLTVAGTIHSTAGGIEFPDGSTQTSASTMALSSGTLLLPSGLNGTTPGNVDLQTETASKTMTDRLLIAGTAKTMSGTPPQANVFSVAVAKGDAAGGRVKFTLVASDGTHYAMETGEIIYLADPTSMNCAIVISEYSAIPPTYTNTTLAVPAIGQTGALNAQCMATTFTGNPGMIIYDTLPTSFTPTTHKLYYTIENQSQTPLTLQP